MQLRHHLCSPDTYYLKCTKNEIITLTAYGSVQLWIINRISTSKLTFKLFSVFFLAANRPHLLLTFR